MRFRRSFAGMIALAALIGGTPSEVAAGGISTKAAVPAPLDRARAAQLLFGNGGRPGPSINSVYKGWKNCSARGFKRRARSDYRTQFNSVPSPRQPSR